MYWGWIVGHYTAPSHTHDAGEVGDDDDKFGPTNFVVDSTTEVLLDRMQNIAKLIGIVSLLVALPLLWMAWVLAANLAGLLMLNERRTFGLMRLRGISGQLMGRALLISVSTGGLAGGILGLLAGSTSLADTSWGRGSSSDELSAYQRSLFGPQVLERHRAFAERLRIVADGAGLPPAQVALAWVTLGDAFTVAVAGSTSAANTRANAAAGNLVLAPSVMADLAALRLSG